MFQEQQRRQDEQRERAFQRGIEERRVRALEEAAQAEREKAQAEREKAWAAQEAARAARDAANAANRPITCRTVRWYGGSRTTCE
jgi:hypothetical protein